MARSDMFFKATGQRTGEILGESSDKRFPNQIELVDWSWGMSAPTAVGGQRTGRVLMGDLLLIKRVCRASTSLMSVMNNNELLSTAVLSVRKSGGLPLPYFVMELTGARITGYDVQSDVGADGAPGLTEHLRLTYKRVRIDYVPQSSSGGATGASSFEADSAIAS